MSLYGNYENNLKGADGLIAIIIKILCFKATVHMQGEP